MSNFIEDLESLDDEEIKATKVLNGIIAGDKVYTEKELNEKYISKSKIKEKIEKLEKTLKKEEGDLELEHALGTTIMHLKEILESEE